MDVDTTSGRLQTSNNIIIIESSVILEGELSSAEMQAAVGNNYGKLQFDFNNFQNIMKKSLSTTKSVCKQHATLTVFKII